jgi:hypothetical protein
LASCFLSLLGVAKYFWCSGNIKNDKAG